MKIRKKAFLISEVETDSISCWFSIKRCLENLQVKEPLEISFTGVNGLVFNSNR